jgi:outer membrane lipoprotein-sorting protein
VDGDRIIVIDDDSVQIYDREGNLVRHIPTDGRATVRVSGNRIIVIDDDSVQIYDRDGNLIRHIPTDGRADVIAYENRTITADNSAVQMYNHDGALLLDVPTDGRATMTIEGESLLITTPDGQTTSYSLDQPPLPPPFPGYQIFLPVVIK